MLALLKKELSFRNILLMTCGTALMAFATASIFDPASIVTGGFTGISIMVRQITKDIVPGGVPLSLTNIVLNLPLFIIATRIRGRSFIIRTAWATVFLSIWLSVLPVIPIAGDDMLLAALYGGIFMGAGIGLVFAAQSSTGGSDLIATLIHHFMRQYSISAVMWVIDTAIVIVGAYLFGVRMALYAIIAIYLTSLVSDRIIEGMKFSKAAFIITNHSGELSHLILEDLGRGVTAIPATGMYSGSHRDMLLCVVSRKEIVRLKELAKSSDPDAFVIVTDVREVLGEGFIEKE